VDEPRPSAARPPAEGATTVLGQPKLDRPAGLDPKQTQLWEGTRDALFALPSYFNSRLQIQDVLATDLHTFNGSLGATIEQQVVDTLNGVKGLRDVWDDGSWALYRWERQSQTFPDVVLRTTAPGRSSEPVMGLEMKGWYVLAREREPSGRFRTTPAACSPMDLLVVVPWALDAAISGSPRLFSPYVVSAREAALYRNYWWEHVRQAKGASGITLSTVNRHYPAKDDKIGDRPLEDDGHNFGRYSRTGAMDEYIARLFNEHLAGIPLDSWQSFLKRFHSTAED